MEGTWVFGYGSIIWKPAFCYETKICGFIKGYKRRFWQGSNDHRGTVEQPGRVVTLVPSKNSEKACYGVCYKIPAGREAEVIENLDFRERGGYTRTAVHMYTDASPTEPVILNAVIYIGVCNNEQWLGPSPLDEIAQQIATAVGPSGKNIDYLLNLAASLRELNVNDPHIFELERRVKLSISSPALRSLSVERVELPPASKVDSAQVIVN